MLAEVWGESVGTFAGDRDLDRVIEALELVALDDQVGIEALPGDRRGDAELRVRARLGEAAPALLALAVRTVPSRRDEVAGRLKHLVVVCSDELILEYRYDGERKIHDRAPVYMDRPGVAYLKLNGDEPDWSSFAFRLAEYLELDLGDGFAFVLAADERARTEFLRAHGLTEEDLTTAGEYYDDAHRPELAANLEADADPAYDEQATVDDPPKAGEPELSGEAMGDHGQGERSGVTEAHSADVVGGHDGVAERSGEAADEGGSDTPDLGGPTVGAMRLPRRATRDPATAGHAAAAARSSAGSSRASTSRSGSTSEADEQRRFYSYVVRADSREARMAQRAEQQAMRIGQQGVEHVVAYEASQGRDAVPQDHSNKGFDVLSARPDGSDRRTIEVKATERAWPTRGIPVSRHQVDMNREIGDEFWLYVVEFATDPERARVIPIQNPASAIDYCVFDPGWENLSE